MGAGQSQNFDAAFFKKYATPEYYLSRGASGHVYGPIQWNAMQLAIKQTTFAAGKVTKELKQEIEVKKDIWTSIEHEHLLRIHFVDFNQLPKSMSIVMEFAAGGSLHGALRSLERSGQKLPIYIVTDWAKQIAEGMLYLHEKHIVHRDLKSSNILLMEPFDIRKPRKKVTLKIADFDEVKDHEHTMTMSLVGTVAYMAPEVIVKQRFSKGSDVWSYGVVIWEMVTGDTPHKGLEPNLIMHKAIQGELDSLKIEESFPLFLKQLLIRCLEPILLQRASFHDVVPIIQAAQSIDPLDDPSPHEHHTITYDNNEEVDVITRHRSPGDDFFENVIRCSVSPTTNEVNEEVDVITRHRSPGDDFFENVIRCSVSPTPNEVNWIYTDIFTYEQPVDKERVG